MSPHLFGALALGLGLQRLAELATSARHRRTLGPPVAGPNRAEPGLLALHVAALLLPWVEVELRARPLAPAPLAIGGALLVAAQLVRLWTLRALGVHWTVLPSVFAGQRLVTDGPYARLRHPNYLAVAVELLALPLAGGAWLSLLVLNLLHLPVLARRIAVEERSLARLPGFTAFAAGRGRLLPRITLRGDTPRALLGNDEPC